MAQLRKLMENYTTKVFGVSPSTWTDFEYHGETEEPNTLISTNISIPLSVVTLYCVGIPLLQLFMRSRKVPNNMIKPILFLHNIALSLLSLYLTLFMGSTVLSYGKLEGKTYFDMFCTLNREDQKGTLNWLYYINLLVKYYELIDTVFLVIKKKPVTFFTWISSSCNIGICMDNNYGITRNGMDCINIKFIGSYNNVFLLCNECH